MTDETPDLGRRRTLAALAAAPLVAVPLPTLAFPSRPLLANGWVLLPGDRDDAA
ncbi:hypothetical protein R5H30_00515 [Sulfitobacter sp. D35]|uniref:hypothetical protein n=1 Tax=Sulfitobacter sp. D35 TaxID=3083252 RepID=UPI00296FBD38|nr:hypothetical protein [Sulfitobacter sp. D35]MDW4496446.1 hypothetical protein [Sulfitobacter sp. D35]